jgi:hypothetical protein
MKKILSLSFLILFVICLSNCRQNKTAKTWYRGNTHAHTVICGHADSPADVVAKWYLDHGYNFLILSEHNHYINPDSVQLPENRRSDFILIPGEEVTGPRVVHSTGMNTDHLVSQDNELDIKSEIIQNHVDLTLEAGGHTILNHPNYRWALTAEDILPVKYLYMFELYNGHPAVHNFGDEEHISTEKLWDVLLTKGMLIYGVSSDDAHHFATIDTNYSNPGRGWVMVHAAALSADAITHAMIQGDFYSSSGVILKECAVSDGQYIVQIDTEQTKQELALEELHGNRTIKKEVGYLIEFIGPQGTTLSSFNATEARFSIDSTQAYIRVKITCRRMHPVRGMEEYYAWGQPVFNDGRQNDLIDKEE